MKEVTFIKKSIYGAKGERRSVTDRAAEQYFKLDLIEAEKKELEPEVETKDLNPEIETKPLNVEAEKKEVKVTTSPKEEKPKKGPKGKK